MSVSYTMFEEAMEELTRMRERIEQLEDLCRGLWECSTGAWEFECIRPEDEEDCPTELCEECEYGTYPLFDKMQELGLLEEQ